MSLQREAYVDGLKTMVPFLSQMKDATDDSWEKDILTGMLAIINKMVPNGQYEELASSVLRLQAGVAVTFDQILSLVPQYLQGVLTRLDTDQLRFAWLDENLLNVLIVLTSISKCPTRYFARDLATYANIAYDQVCQQEWGFETHLDLQVMAMESNVEEELWNQGGIYTVPGNTTHIVYFLNEQGVHWIMCTMVMNEHGWLHQVYDSMEGALDFETIDRMKAKMIALEKLIRGASGFPQISDPSSFIGMDSAQQENGNDCGIIALYNAIKKLRGEPNELEVDTFLLRVRCLHTIYEELKRRSRRDVILYQNPHKVVCQRLFSQEPNEIRRCLLLYLAGIKFGFSMGL